MSSIPGTTQQREIEYAEFDFGSHDNVQPIVVVGMGPVGIQFVRKLVESGCEQKIILFGDEPWDPYDRVKLSALLAGKLDYQDTFESGAQGRDLPFQNGNLVLQKNNRILDIDPEYKTVTDSFGQPWRYSSLVLALGSSPRVPALPGISMQGVFTFRDLNDAQRLSARLVRSRNVIVVGGGLLGLETAHAMARHGTHVTVIEHGQRLMPQQLDEDASELIREHLLSTGIHVSTGNGIRAVHGDQKVESVELMRGQTLPCDTLVVCAGIVPRTRLALNAEIAIGRGIRVNDQLETSVPDIYAIGECAEHSGNVFGLVAPGYEQAAVLASNLAGKKSSSSSYQGSVSTSRLKVLELPVLSAGAVGEEEYQLDLRNIVFRSPDSRFYRKLVMKRSRVVGVIAVGEWSESHRIQEAVEQQRLLWPWQLKRFIGTGHIWPEDNGSDISTWGNSVSICNCKSVSLGDLRRQMAGGCGTVARLSECTGASTVCGSCKPLLEQLVNGQGQKEATPGLRILFWSALITTGLLMMWLMIPAIAPGESVQDLGSRMSHLWHDGTLKQVTGYSLLGVLLVSLLVSLRKRLKVFSFGAFANWRVVHTVLATLLLVVLIAHTGFSLGNSFNAALMINFLLVAAVGALSGASFMLEKTRYAMHAQGLKNLAMKSHIYVAWPLPVLILFHIITVYYF